MKKIAFAFIAAMAVLSFAGCKKKGDDAAAKIKGFKDQMCACKDKACADDVNKKYMDWGASMAKGKEGDQAAKPDENAMKLAKEYGDCYAKHMAPPTPDPAAAPPAGDPAAPAGDPAAAPPEGGDDMKKEEGGDMKKEEAK